jgi:SAM-dependent methyltransferase
MRREGPLIPARTLRTLLRGGRSIDLVYSGYSLEPLLRHGCDIEVDPGAEVAAGDFVLCQVGGWADVRRVLSVGEGGTVATALDAVPGALERIDTEALLGVLRGVRGAGDRLGRLIISAFPLWTRISKVACRLRRILDASSSGQLGPESVRDKYEQQVAGYRDQLERLPDRQSVEDLCRSLCRGARILIVGSGAGSEVLHLARRGFRVTGFDFSAGMVQACREMIAREGIAADILQADLSHLDLGERSFEAVYFTPLVYSFLSGWSRRVRALHRLGRYLAPGGVVVLSFQRVTSIDRSIELGVHWLISRVRGRETEPGDWYTTFLMPAGTIGRSFIHLFRWKAVVGEVRLAGFREVKPIGPAHLVAREFQRTEQDGVNLLTLP